MAIKKQTLSQDQLSELNAFLNQYFPEELRAQAIKEAKTTGKISSEMLGKIGVVNPSTVKFIQDEVTRVTGGSPAEVDYTRTELKRELAGKSGKPIDESNLTDDELTRRRDLYQQLGQSKESLSGFPSQVQEEYKRKLSAYGIKPESIDQVANAFSQFTQELGRYPTADEFRQRFSDPNSLPNNFLGINTGAFNDPALQNFINDQNARNELSGTFDRLTGSPDTGEDISRIEELLTMRRGQADTDRQLEDHIQGLRGELGGITDERIRGLRELGGQQFQEAAPGVLEREAAMGRLHSGSAGNALTGLYGDINQRIESEVANLKTGDEEFFFNAAYQNKIRQLMEGRTDLGSALNTGRQNARMQQDQRFQQGQFNLNANLQNDLLMQNYQNQLQAAQSMRQRQREMQNKARNAGMIGTVGGLAGAAIGTAIAPGVGTMVGSGIGSGIGGLFGSR